MKKYAIVNVRNTDYKDTSYNLAVYLGPNYPGRNREGLECFMIVNNSTQQFGICQYKNFETKIARNLSPEARKILVDVAKGFEKQEQIKMQIKNLENESWNIRKLRDEQYKGLVATKGNLTKEDFTSLVMENLPDSVKREMARVRWNFENPVAIGYYPKDLYISREEVLDKYIGESYSFVYRDGYGDIRMHSDCEDDKEYKSIIKRCREELPINTEFKDTLSIGDKNTLVYSACYHIPLEEDLTADYAKKIVAKLVGKTRSLDSLLNEASNRPKESNNIKSLKDINKSKTEKNTL